MRLNFALAFAPFVLLCACNKQDTSNPANTSQPATSAVVNQLPATPAPAPVKATADEWRSAVAESHIAIDSKTDEGGVTNFGACFEGTKDKCTLRVAGSRDPFRKLRHFTPFDTRIAGVFNKTYLGSYIALADCDEPSFFLQPRFGTKGSWIFMKSVSVMADGEVVFEKDFSGKNVTRETTSPGVEESYDFIVSDSEIKALRKIAAADSIIVRVTGDKGYVNVPKKDAELSKADLATNLKIFDKLTAATEKKIPETCPL